MNEIDQLIREIKKLGYIPGNEGYTNEDELLKGNFTWREWRIPQEYHKLKRTRFYYRHEKDFIHFTSLESVYSILNDKHIRLYNLVNMDDKLELEYAKNELMFRGNEDNFKEKLFCLSMCSANDILDSENKEHLLWKLHGRNGYGAIVRMSFENNMDLWYSYYLAKMFYNSDSFKSIKELHSKTQNEYLDTTLACFLKLPIYSFENEIRLVFNRRNTTTVTSKDGNLIYPIVHPDKMHKEDNIAFIQLPLLNFYQDDETYIPFKSSPWKGFQEKDNEIPKIRITEIILGYRYSETDIANIQAKIDFQKLGINVNISKLKKYF